MVKDYLKDNAALILGRVNKVVDEAGVEGDEKTDLQVNADLVEMAIECNCYGEAVGYLMQIAFEVGCSVDYLLGRADTFSLF